MLNELNSNLLNLAWSLWTELGVAGNVHHHQKHLILLEELIIFTSCLSEIDPRLRDESIDWCSKYHHFISISRLKALIENFEESAKELFSNYASSLNNVSQARWPVFVPSKPLQIELSHKSILRPRESPALLSIRARSIFGTGARADIVVFFLTHPDKDYSLAELSMIGYTKRNLAEVLDDLHFGDLFHKYMLRNQQRYRLAKNEPLTQLLKPIPPHTLPWQTIFQILLALRAVIERTQNYSPSSKAIEIHNCLKKYEEVLALWGCNPPSLQNDFTAYLKAFNQWILDWSSEIADPAI
ncbi:MAG: hypothetical protein JSR58_03175 [Verrucomicrobia bacterium]|nr:hypothetical protein [Verrucomicrobiota bacterium]